MTTSRHSQRTAIGRKTHQLVVATGSDIRRQRMDAGISLRRLASAAGIDGGYLSQVERGLREPSLAVLVATASALGGDVRLRIYPGTGPRLRDAVQAQMIEALLTAIHPRWTRRLEVPVYRPVRGVIDLVIHDQPPTIVAASEVHSEFRRLEQLIRWSHEKADALQSASMWRFTDSPTVDRLLVVRNTQANRRIANQFAETLGAEYPGSTKAAFAALTTEDGPWIGSALLWMMVDRDGTRLLPGPPRGVTVGA